MKVLVHACIYVHMQCLLFVVAGFFFDLHDPLGYTPKPGSRGQNLVFFPTKHAPNMKTHTHPKTTGMSMILSKWTMTPLQVGFKSRK